MIITNELELSFYDQKGPKIYTHYGEKNRRIILYTELYTGTTYTVDFRVVKPDGNFVIAPATMTRDDENKVTILVDITDQMTTATGVGKYIVRLSYNNDTIVYSQEGDFWVDDALITDELIESVSEVNGYVFPNDFATKDDVSKVIANPEEEAVDLLKTVSIDGTVYTLPTSSVSFRPLEPDVLMQENSIFTVETEVH